MQAETATSSTPASSPAEVVPGSQPMPPTIAALLRPGAYWHPTDGIKLHETHISWVILAGPFAYKIKKPVNFGFLDFTTRERRLADCADEIRLNRRLCPDVYLGIVDVVERDGGYFLGGPGRPVEPPSGCAGLPERGMLTAMLARQAVGPQLVRRIARQGLMNDSFGAPFAQYTSASRPDPMTCPMLFLRAMLSVSRVGRSQARVADW